MRAEIASEIEAVVWDLDGTLLNSHSIYTELVTDIAPIFNLEPPSQEAYEANFHGTLNESILNAFEGRLLESQLDDFVEHFLEKQDSKYIEIEEHILTDALNLSKQLTLRGVKQAIVTNREHGSRGHASPRSIVERSSLKEHIQHIICGDETGARKPDQMVVGDLIEEWQIKPNKIIVIGDQHVDAQLALNMGSRAIIVTRNGSGLAHELLSEPDWRDRIAVVLSLDEVTVLR